ncbi:SPJ_0845 family protein [Streptococcus caprae]|uniref:SPJ_0845 family protein n=1 Tax=Streptococcus caprae TaxID=1640501 RepID=A0ABV8CY02_9STRE
MALTYKKQDDLEKILESFATLPKTLEKAVDPTPETAEELKETSKD